MFNSLIRGSLNNRLLVLVAAALMLVAGAFMLRQTPVDVFPDLNRPTVTVMTEAGGMAPEEVEQLISTPLETVLNGMPGIVNIRSVSSAGLSFVYLTFDWNVDLYRARQLVAERLQLAREQLPPGVAPAMGPVASIMGEIMLIAIPIDPAKISPMATREYADFVLRRRLLAIPGVAQVIPIGGEVRQFQVQPDPDLMARYGVALKDLEEALRGFAGNSSGGFLELDGREYLIRHLGRTAKLDDLQRLAVAVRNGQPIVLGQVAKVSFGAAIRRGDAGFDGKAAVVLSVQKQPDADTVALTRKIEAALAELKRGLPAGLAEPRVTFRQADFIEASIGNLQTKLLGAGVFVAVVLYLFLGNRRTTAISLAAIPLSLLATAIVFHYFGWSLNTMTLGGLAIAIGELVDDAVVDVENILRRLKNNQEAANPEPPLSVVLKASLEVRGAVVYATVIIALVFVPLFVLPGVEGRLFVPLGLAYVVSILASLLVAVTVTPVLAYFLLPRLAAQGHPEPRFTQALKRGYERVLGGLLESRSRARLVVLVAGVGVVGALVAVPFFARTFLPPFNEGSALVGLRLKPGTTLSESELLGRQAEVMLKRVPEVVHVGRRSGRAELDEHAEGVHSSELDVKLKRSKRPLEAVYADMRAALATLPASISVGQPISHRLDHMLSGVRAQIALKVFGDDLDTLRGEADTLFRHLSEIPGVVDLEIEKQVLTPQVKVRLDHAAAAAYGISPARLAADLQMLVEGEKLAQVVDGNRRFDLVLRLPEARRSAAGLADLLIDTPRGRVPLKQLAAVEVSDGPNQIVREDGRRRIVLQANAGGRPLSEVVADIRAMLAEHKLPENYFTTLGGQFQAQEQATQLIAGLAAISAALIFLVLYSRYRSSLLALLIMANVPLALVGAVVGLKLSGQPLSVAATIGFITLAGIATRNGILKVSHYANLCAFEGESFGRKLVVRGSLERLTPVLMTALVAAFALAPLLFEAEEPGAEILHPVAVVIFSGLISSTLLDTFFTPAAFWLWGEKPLARLLAQRQQEAY